MARRKKADGAAPKARKAKTNGNGGSPGVGHNSAVEMSDAERQGMFVEGVKEICGEHRKIADLKAEIATIVSGVRTSRKALKKFGFTKTMVDHAIYLETADVEQAAQKQREEMQAAVWMGKATGYQFNLFDSDPTPSVEKAFAEGRVAGLRGESCKLPEKWHEGTPQGQEWMKGWHEGQGVLFSDGFKLLKDSLTAEDKPLPPIEGASHDDVPLPLQ